MTWRDLAHRIVQNVRPAYTKSVPFWNSPLRRLPEAPPPTSPQT